MDCDTGAALGRGFDKDAMMMHNATARMNMGMPEEDAVLMNQMPMMQPMNAMGQEWANNFSVQPQQQHMVKAMRQQHEMDKAFQMSSMQQQQQHQQQHQQHQQHLQQMGGMPMMHQQMHSNMMMSGAMMTAATMGLGMIPRSQFQPLITPQQQMSTLQQPQQQVSTTVGTDSAWVESLASAKWAQDFSNVQEFHLDGDEPKSVTEKTKDSEFFAFMDKIRNKEVLLNEETGTVEQGPGPEADVKEDAEYISKWAEEEGDDLNFEMNQLNMSPSFQPGERHIDPMLDPEAENLLDPDTEDWIREYKEKMEMNRKAVNSTDYPFEPNNPYVHHDSPMQEGIELLQHSNLAEAALAFEAVCQKDADNLEGWIQLGLTQAGNEKDQLAILALNNARKLKPDDLRVHAALAVSHTNDHNTEAAMEALKAWVLCHPEYKHLEGVPHTEEPEIPMDYEGDDFLSFESNLLNEVKGLYMAAIELNPNELDLYPNLAVLYSLSGDFDEAAEYMQKAVNLKPTDANLWNRYGAILANGSHPEKALEAYDRALDINPGHVRTMYNSCVAYSNMGNYEAATKKLLHAIAAQHGGTNPEGVGAKLGAKGMWDLLRMTLNLMGRQDLVELSWREELPPLLKEFGLEEII